jgi:hypothetical protein
VSPKRTDANHSTIVAALTEIGADVIDMHELGHGVPDMAVWFGRRWTVLEVKTAKGTLTSDERDWHLRHPGAAHIVRTVDEALVAIGAIGGEKE